MSLSRPLRLFLLLLPLLGGLLLSMDWAGRQARQQALRAEGEQVRKQLDLYAGSLQTLIERFRSLPAVLALDPDLRAALAGPIDGELQQRLNLKLESINLAARSSTLELLDRTGLAVAASNWNLPTSYVGHNYGFRPYFRQTIAQGSGRFYAVGVISGIPGYFLSHAVRAEDGSFLGAIVVKLEFPDLERQWNQTPDLVLASDAKGIVFLANHAGWRYRELEPLDTVDRFELAETRQYDRQPLTPLRHQTLRSYGEDSRLARVESADGEKDYLWQSLDLPNDGWTLHLLRDTASIQDDVATARLAAAGTWLALVFLGLFLHQRWRIARLRQRSRRSWSAWSSSAPPTCVPRRTAWCRRPSWPPWGRCRQPWPMRSTSRSPPSACNWPACACCSTPDATTRRARRCRASTRCSNAWPRSPAT